MKSVKIFAVLAILCLAALARPAGATVMISKQDGQWRSLSVTRAKVETLIQGGLAQTVMTLTFGNPTGRALSGELVFPLPAGAVINGYALDINGVMVPASVVPREKARRAFAAEVRRGIDPGLAEWVKGNNFRTRVFPIPAHGSRTVRVSYVCELVGGRDAAQYHLPLNFKQPVKRLELRVEVVKPGQPPRVAGGGLANFSFRQWRDSFVAEADFANKALDRDLIIALPRAGTSPVLLNKSGDGGFYFRVLSFPTPPADLPLLPAGRVLLLWDASASRAGDDHEREYTILKGFLEARRGGPRTVDLVVFRHRPEKTASFAIHQGQGPALFAALKKVSYDGGGAMPDIATLGLAARPDLVLLFSDGLMNFGPSRPGGLAAPLFAVSGAARANHSLLTQVAAESGGAYLNLKQLDNAQAVARLGRAPWLFLGAEFDKSRVSQVYPRASRPAGPRFALCGRLLGDAASLTLTFGTAGKVMMRQKVSLAKGDAAPGNLSALAWAQAKVEELSAFPEANEKQILAVGQAHGLVTPGTSLIVLESLAQYLRHRIEPPKELAQMREEYFTRVENLDWREKTKKADKLERVFRLWQKRVAWWERDFKYPPDFRYQKPEPKPRPLADMARRRLSQARDSMAGSARNEEMAQPRMAMERPAPAMAPPPAPRAAKAAPGAKQGGPAISVRAWDPATPYLQALKQVKRADYLPVYLAQRAGYSESPSFYLDTAAFFFRQGAPELALRAISNLAELKLESPALLRVAAHMLAQNGRLKQAALIFREIKRLRPEEPQSFRDLALVLDRLGQDREAARLLWQVVVRPWERFREIEQTALVELNRILARAARAGKKGFDFVDPRFVKLLDLDLRVVLTWDADLTDMDLWVIEPSSEKAFYGHRLTTIGGAMSRDFTAGYGPEEYLLKKAMTGPYELKVKYFSNRAPKLAGAVTLQVTVFTNYGRPNEKRQSLTLRLRKAKDVYKVGEVKF